MGVDELREASREGMADVCISFMWSYVLWNMCVTERKPPCRQAACWCWCSQKHVGSQSSCHPSEGIEREGFNSNGSLNIVVKSKESSWQQEQRHKTLHRRANSENKAKTQHSRNRIKEALCTSCSGDRSTPSHYSYLELTSETQAL